MIISHGPQKNNGANGQHDPVSQIELFNGEGLFKKKKRTFNRNSLVTSLNQDLPPHRDSMAQVKPKRTLNDE